MTEDEAKTKWCPWVQVQQGNANYHPWSNRGEVDYQGTDLSSRCIAAACMAWRPNGSALGEIVERRPAAPGSTNPGPDKGWSFRRLDDEFRGIAASTPGEWIRRAPGIPTGFCGLAGRPE